MCPLNIGLFIPRRDDTGTISGGCVLLLYKRYLSIGSHGQPRLVITLIGLLIGINTLPSLLRIAPP